MKRVPVKLQIPKKRVGVFPFSIVVKSLKQIGNSAKKKLDDRTKMPVTKMVLRNKSSPTRFCCTRISFQLKLINFPQNSRSIEQIPFK